MNLKPSEIQDVNAFAATHPLGILLSEIKHWNFEVGDILIRFKKDFLNPGAMHIDNVSEVCPVPKKYRVMHVDDLGIPWVKQLSVRGGLGSTLYCLANQNPELYRYKVDPEQAEAILLGYKYDPRAEYRRMRNQNPDYGSKK